MQYGDLPTIRRNNHGVTAVYSCGVPRSLITQTAHIEEDQHRQVCCHQCGRRVNVSYRKPGSPYVWCLACTEPSA